MQSRLTASPILRAAAGGGALAALLRLALAITSMLAAAVVVLAVAVAVALLGSFGLLRRAWLALLGRPNTPWLLPLLLRLLARTRFGGLAARYRAAQPAAGRAPAANDADVTDVVARPLRD